MSSIEKMMKEETWDTLNKKEKLVISRDKEKLEKVLGGIADLTRLPAAIFVVDAKKEHIAISEARKLNIPVIAMVDTNSDPTIVDYPIPANDDAFKSVAIITAAIGQAIEEALSERKREKDDQKLKEDEDAKREVDAEIED
jgi:small subunit ribosomal protein S2